MKAFFFSATGCLLTALGLGFAGTQQLGSSTEGSAIAFNPLQPTQTKAALVMADMSDSQFIAQSTDPSSVLYSVCAHVADWQRPEESQHLRHLETMPRYGEAVHQAPLKTMLADFRNFQVIFFTTYGLSARQEPLHMAGVWSAIDDMEGCYDQGQPVRISNGELGETWLLDYRLVELSWADGRYQLLVEPASGLQVVQFERQESLAALPLQVQTPAGNTVEAHSGDW